MITRQQKSGTEASDTPDTIPYPAHQTCVAHEAARHREKHEPKRLRISIRKSIITIPYHTNSLLGSSFTFLFLHTHMVESKKKACTQWHSSLTMAFRNSLRITFRFLILTRLPTMKRRPSKPPCERPCKINRRHNKPEGLRLLRNES